MMLARATCERLPLPAESVDLDPPENTCYTMGAETNGPGRFAFSAIVAQLNVVGKVPSVSGPSVPPFVSATMATHGGHFAMDASKTCSICGLPKDIEEFPRDRTRRDGRRSACQTCQRRRDHERYVRTGPKDRTRRRAADERYMSKPGATEREQRRQRRYHAGLRLDALIHYGGPEPACACCGERTVEFLSIDHINGGGSSHRKSIKISLYKWLRDQSYPDGYRVLCHNCNLALGFYGRCPHQGDSHDR